VKPSRLLFFVIAAGAAWFVWTKYGDQIRGAVSGNAMPPKRDIGPGSHFTLPWESPYNAENDFASRIAQAIGATPITVK